MLFIGISLIVAIGLALMISADAGSLVGLTQQQTGQLVPLLILLVVFAGGAFMRRRRVSELFGNLLLWGAIFGVALVGYTYRDDLQGVAARVFGELVPGSAVIDDAHGSATFRSGRDGHFQVQAKINGADITTIFDTGASAVVLTSADARKAGVDTTALHFDVPVSTANGTARAASVLLDSIEIGNITRHGIHAFVAEDDALDTSLLGMSFLKTLSRYAVTANSLELVD